MTAPLPEQPRYRVLVDDNFHYMDESERYEHGTYADCASAIRECKTIVDRFLLAEHKPGMTEEKLWQLYTLFGDDPFIVSADGECAFSAWDHARQRCREICSAARP